MADERARLLIEIENVVEKQFNGRWEEVIQRCQGRADLLTEVIG